MARLAPQGGGEFILGVSLHKIKVTHIEGFTGVLGNADSEHFSEEELESFFFKGLPGGG